MDGMVLVAGCLSALLFAYLTIALIKPEWFS